MSSGRGWHHDWEATLSCQGSTCTVARGLRSGLKFMPSGTAVSLDGNETWQIYQPYSSPALKESDNHNLLARRPSGEFIVFLADGREMWFASVCDACSPSDASSPRCLDPLAGGMARLVKVVDAGGRAVSIRYDRPGGLILGLADALGHALEARSPAACQDERATELRYDGMLVATYQYEGPDLQTALDSEGRVLRSYVYDPNGSGLLRMVRNEAGDTVAEFSYDDYWRAIGVTDRRSTVTISYGASVAVTEWFGTGQVTSTRTVDRDGHVTSVSAGCSCGPGQTVTWTNRRPICTVDAMGHVVHQEFDTLGRLTRRAEYAGTSCPPPPLPADSRDQSMTYGVVRQVAQGVSLALDFVTSTSRVSVSYSQNRAVQTYSYDQGPSSMDPAGYSCTTSPLPSGSVVCREVGSGYAFDPTTLGWASERHATFFSYDSQGRLVRKIGPLNLDHPSPSDVTPIEERTYWADTETLPRRGRLREVRRFASPAPPLVTSYEYDAFGAYQVTAPNAGITTIIRDGRGRPRFVVDATGRSVETRYYDGLEPRLRLQPSGAVERSTYDARGRLAAVERLAGDPDQPGAVAWSELYTYDPAGNAVHVERRDATGTATWRQDREFDVQHRLTREIHPEDATRSRRWDYDAAAFLTAITDEEGRATQFTPDGLDRVKKVRRTGVDAQGNPTGLDVAQYTYDSQNEGIAQAIDGANRTTYYKADDFGRVAYVSSTSSGTQRYGFDARGNVLKRIYDYLTLTYTYDGLDRVLTVVAQDSAAGSTATQTSPLRRAGRSGPAHERGHGRRSRTVRVRSGGADHLGDPGGEWRDGPARDSLRVRH